MFNTCIFCTVSIIIFRVGEVICEIELDSEVKSF